MTTDVIVSIPRELLARISDNIPGEKGFHHSLLPAQWEAIRELRALLATAQPVQTWIPISEQPPKKGRYLVCADTDDGEYVCEMSFNGEEWLYESQPVYAHPFYIEPTDWMPMPAAANKSKEDK